ncbi:hypothetical protein Ddc_19046 [Ditylenchus destructor]|nr:hypothetical protein Ddc_19046 [Ditylenchus destructor]
MEHGGRASAGRHHLASLRRQQCRGRAPGRESLKDFEQRISDALNSIAEQEQRPVSEVLVDVRRAFADLIAVRVIHDDTSEGTIPINDGVLLVARARDMLKSAALALYAKRRQFSGHPTDEAKAYLDSLLLGQTEVGSYVINVFAPIPPPQPAQPGGRSDRAISDRSHGKSCLRP